jgi:hypothetical protein
VRIFDRIASGAKVYDHNGDSVEIALRKPVNEFVRVIADDAARYDERYPAKQSYIHKNEFGPMLAPFAHMWVEWALPFSPDSFVTPDGRVAGEPEAIAVLVESDERPYGYEMRCGPVITYRRGQFASVLPVGVRVEADKSGNCLGVYQVSDQAALADQERNLGQERDWVSPLFPLFQTVGWMNCRTFDLVEVQVPTKVAAKRSRLGQFVGLSYHRLEIGAKYRKQWQGRGGLSANRFHVVRGHFADHRTHGLFGDPARRGMYWVPGHARGDKSLGTINKEYHVTDEAAQ